MGGGGGGGGPGGDAFEGWDEWESHSSDWFREWAQFREEFWTVFRALARLRPHGSLPAWCTLQNMFMAWFGALGGWVALSSVVGGGWTLPGRRSAERWEAEKAAIDARLEHADNRMKSVRRLELAARRAALAARGEWLAEAVEREGEFLWQCFPFLFKPPRWFARLVESGRHQEYNALQLQLTKENLAAERFAVVAPNRAEWEWAQALAEFFWEVESVRFWPKQFYGDRDRTIREYARHKRLPLYLLTSSEYKKYSALPRDEMGLAELFPTWWLEKNMATVPTSIGDTAEWDLMPHIKRLDMPPEVDVELQGCTSFDDVLHTMLRAKARGAFARDDWYCPRAWFRAKAFLWGISVAERDAMLVDPLGEAEQAGIIDSKDRAFGSARHSVLLAQDAFEEWLPRALRATAGIRCARELAADVRREAEERGVSPDVLRTAQFAPGSEEEVVWAATDFRERYLETCLRGLYEPEEAAAVAARLVDSPGAAYSELLAFCEEEGAAVARDVGAGARALAALLRQQPPPAPAPVRAPTSPSSSDPSSASSSGGSSSEDGDSSAPPSAASRWWDGRLLSEGTERLDGLAGERAGQRRVAGQMLRECPSALQGGLAGGDEEYAALLLRAEAADDPQTLRAWEGSFNAVAEALQLLPGMGDEGPGSVAAEARWDTVLGTLEGHLERLSLPWRDELIERLETEAALVVYGSDYSDIDP